MEIDALLAQKIQNSEQTDPAAGNLDHIQYDDQQQEHPNVIGNLHEVKEEELIQTLANKENIPSASLQSESNRGDSQMNTSSPSKTSAMQGSSMLPRSRKK